MVPPDQRSVRRATIIVLGLVSVLGVASCSSVSGSDGAGGSGEAGGSESGVARAASPEEVVVGDLPDELTIERPETVAMVGDSITVAAADHLEEGLASLGLDVLTIDAQIGRRMTVGEPDRLQTGADVVEFVAAASSPDLWVVALGTNDIGQYDDVAAVTQQVEEVLDRLPSGVPVVWVDTWIRDRDEPTEMVNRAIREVIDERDGAVVVEWSAHAPDDGVIAGDGVHLTDEVGRQRFTDVVVAGVEALIGSTG
ncbi:MAG: GDSL-type esterase/lipase family protein [Ilumatobacteraceae bacterium]